MKFEVGKFYRRRDGHKAEIMDIQSGVLHCKKLNPHGVTIGFFEVWERNGRRSYLEHSEDATDLVAEWADESKGPVQEVTVVHKKLVEGTYSGITITQPKNPSQIEISYAYRRVDAKGLRGMISVLTSLAEFLEEQNHA